MNTTYPYDFVLIYHDLDITLLLICYYTAIFLILDYAQSTVAYRSTSPSCTRDGARNLRVFFFVFLPSSNYTLAAGW